MRDFAGALFLVDWTFVDDPQAITLDFGHPFVSGKNDDSMPFDMGYVGEVPQEKYKASTLVLPASLCPKCYVGISDWWENGWPTDADPVTIGPDGIAVACEDDLAGRGAYDFGYDLGYDSPEVSP